jgi:RNA binding exosome subunit
VQHQLETLSFSFTLHDTEDYTKMLESLLKLLGVISNQKLTSMMAEHNSVMQLINTVLSFETYSFL